MFIHHKHLIPFFRRECRYRRLIVLRFVRKTPEGIKLKMLTWLLVLFLLVAPQAVLLASIPMILLALRMHVLAFGA